MALFGVLLKDPGVLLKDEQRPAEGISWGAAGLRMAYVAQHAFHHVEKQTQTPGREDHPRVPLKGPQKGTKKGLKNPDFDRILTGF